MEHEVTWSYCADEDTDLMTRLQMTFALSAKAPSRNREGIMLIINQKYAALLAWEKPRAYLTDIKNPKPEQPASDFIIQGGAINEH
ncbi:hypothetical protein [Aeromonas veronii]|uniref:hypothetical protein n=1 Tax=Aeromonas veronii TaxID=654 RepID=UPI001F29E6F1|nr:hypothetical protein [Aeromonas veronii]MCF5845627.1 hypothetical protein [Aeromonas veronii]